MKNRMFGKIAGEFAGRWSLKTVRRSVCDHVGQALSGIIAVILASFAVPSAAVAADAVLLDFTSAHCGPCQAMQPIIAQLEQSGVPVRHVDVQSEPQFASRFGVRQTPTFVVLSSGKEVTRLVGMHSAGEIREALAINPSGPLIPTGSQVRGPEPLSAPQTRLAPATQQPAGALSLASTQPSEPMPSVGQAGAIERAQAATVRLRVYDGQGFGAGTGTIIDTHGNEALVLTCGHLFRETKGQGKIEVDLFVGGQTQTVQGQMVDYDADNHDIALVVIQPGFAVQPVKIMAFDQQLKNGQPVFSYGCDRGDDPSRRDTRITGLNKYNQHLGASNIEIAGAPIDGRSGGGLFDAQGRLIGVCNAADYQGDVGIYTGPGSVRWQLDRVKLARLYQAPGDTAVAQQDSPPAASPPVQMASLQNAPQQNAVSQASATTTSQQEVIVIVRDRNNPNGSAQVMNLQPSAELMQTLQRYSR